MFKRTAAYFLVILLFLEGAVFASEFRFSPRPNKAHLIQWRPWGPEALAEAKGAGKLILLSLSAVWCHWCHVMDETTYSDDLIIAYINEHFIPVRVDADMRPDVDSLYNQGGWPSTVFLTHQGAVVDGGNYIPTEEMRSRLSRIAADYTREGDRIARRPEEDRDRRSLPRNVITSQPDQETIDRIVEFLQGVFDETNGGFGSGQKFPNPDAMDFLLAEYRRQPDPAIRRVVTLTLDRMAQGGLYDRVEGGFFRYATKPNWSQPHYEKMLAVNAGLIGSYARAYLVFGEKKYLNIVKSSVGYVRTRLYDPKTGALFGSQDADESYYRKKNRKKLKAPLVDRSSYADASSLMISALVASWEATGDQHYLQTAVRAASFLVKEQYQPAEGVFHAYRDQKASLPGQLGDNVLFGAAMLDLYNATGDPWYHDRAGRVGQVVMASFYENNGKRFRSSLVPAGVSAAAAGFSAEMNDLMANYRAARFLARLSAYSRDRQRRETVQAVLTTLSDSYRSFPPLAPSYGLALRWVLAEPVEFHVLADGKRAKEYLTAIGGIYLPEKVVRTFSLVNDRDEIKSYGYRAAESVYICAGRRCSRPVKDPAKIGEELKEFMIFGAGDR